LTDKEHEMSEKGTSIYCPTDVRDQLQIIGELEHRNTIDTIRYLIALYWLTDSVERAQILSRREAK